jgi:mRNA interferase MazF
MSIQRGEVYWVDLNPVVGREQKGIRPAVVVSSDKVNSAPLVVLVVPGTHGRHVRTDYPENVRVPAGEANLPDETVFMTFQMRAVDRARLQGAALGQLGQPSMEEIDAAMGRSLSLRLALKTTP